MAPNVREEVEAFLSETSFFGISWDGKTVVGIGPVIDWSTGKPVPKDISEGFELFAQDEFDEESSTFFAFDDLLNALEDHPPFTHTLAVH